MNLGSSVYSRFICLILKLNHQAFFFTKLKFKLMFNLIKFRFDFLRLRDPGIRKSIQARIQPI